MVTQEMPYRFSRAGALTGANVVPLVVRRMAPPTPAV